MTHIHWVARQNKLEIPKDKRGSLTVGKCDPTKHKIVAAHRKKIVRYGFGDTDRMGFQSNMLYIF